MVKRVNMYVKETCHVDTDLKKIIDEQSVAWNDARQKERGDKPRSLYASDYGQCMRKTWFQFFPKHFPRKGFDPRTLRIFHNGEDVHMRLSQYFHKSHCIFFEEIDIPRDARDVHGRCDGICIINNKFKVTEFKSINAISVTKPKPEHVGQLTWYMAMFQLRRDELLANRQHHHEYDQYLHKYPIRGELIYESKQNQNTFHFPMELNDADVARVKAWFDELRRYIYKQELPEINYDKSKFPCSWGRGKNKGQCEYYELCHGEENDQLQNALIQLRR